MLSKLYFSNFSHINYRQVDKYNNECISYRSRLLRPPISKGTNAYMHTCIHTGIVHVHVCTS